MTSEQSISGVGEAPEQLVGVLGVFAALLVLVGLIAALLAGFLTGRGGDADVTERLTAILGDGPYVFGLELVEAAQLPTKEVVVRFERPEAEAGDAEPLPVEVVLVKFTNPEAALAALLGTVENDIGGRSGDGGGGHGMPSMEEHGGGLHGASATLMRWEENPDFAWHTAIKSDDIAWGRWRADYRIERSFLEGGSWRDSARVNLSQTGRSLVLFARWPDQAEVSLDVLRELLRKIKMLEIEEA
jgi:hypothetical protein